MLHITQLSFVGVGQLFQEMKTSMANCKNCGYESHCGVPLMKDFTRSPYSHGVEGQIEACKSCRCEKCTAPDWG